MLANISSEPGSVVRALHLLWVEHSLGFTLSEPDRRVDHVNEAILAGTSISSFCTEYFGGNSSDSPAKVFIIW